ncbi:MAG: Nramp family divalent metal transporter [Methylobacteriaceae bacterium]|nr:Nramp family divalent metal transporter [Methylobacteriaceae bacterium]
MSDVSLGESFRSVAVRGAPARRFLAFLGPGYLVATGYMDPGNWATSLAGGSKFGTALLFVVVVSSLMAILLQSLTARLALATGRDLAQLCRDHLPRPVAWLLWVIAECAIIATDLAEVIGTAIGLQLLFGIPLLFGVILTALDVFLILALQRLGFRAVEAFVGALLIVIAVAFVGQLALAQPAIADVLRGVVPTPELFRNSEMLYIALGIIGATVMPHNLYLHSGAVLTRQVGPTIEEKREAIRFATWDSTIALSFALLINGSLLVLAASAFNARGHTDVGELQDAHRLIAPLLGAAAAAHLFALALLACGLNSTVTATLAGQIVMEGFVKLRLPPAARRLFTRLVAIVPAIAVIFAAGEKATGELLVLSQVVLSFALPFAIVPLVWMSASPRIMGALRAPRWVTAVAAVIAAIIIALNLKLLFSAATGA